MSILLIDDLKELDEATHTARTFAEGIAALAEKQWDALYLDHDLGSMVPDETGYGIMKWLETNPQHLPGKIVCVSLSGPGRNNIELVIRKLYGRTWLS